MTHKESFDGRFSTMRSTIDDHFIKWFVDGKITTDDLKLMVRVAKKLDITIGTRSAVDVLYDIARKLAPANEASILEAEVVSPETIMTAIKNYLNE